MGCGWLGQQLASHLRGLNYWVATTNTSAEKTELMKQKGYNSFRVIFSGDRFQDPKAENLEAQTAFDQMDAVIISIPMSRSKDAESQTVLFQNVLSFLGNNKKQIFLMSSTGIYPQVKQYIDEDIFSSDQLENTLNSLEKIFLDKIPEINILRLGGLMGQDRMFYKYYKEAGRYEAVNHVHYQDICRVIEKMISLDLKGKIYNVVAPLHPAKGDVYTYQTGNELDPAIPQKTENRIISSEKMIRELAYTFAFPDPKTFL